MTVELWLGNEYEHTHEMKALGAFLEKMIRLYGESDQLFLVMANFYCGGEEIDLAVFKRDGIVIIELKDVDVSVSGGENGRWMIETGDGSKKPLYTSRSRNPYQQVRTYRFAMMDKLNEDASRIMPAQKAGEMRFDHISTVVALCPEMHEDSLIDISPGSRTWFSVVGLNELPQEVYFRRSTQLNFKKNELRELARIWGLEPCPAERFVPDLERKEKEKAAAEVVEDNQELEQVTRGQPADGYEESDSCPVCRYAGRSCEVPALRGKIAAVHRGRDGQYLLELNTSADEPVYLQPSISWDSGLFPQLERALVAAWQQDGDHDISVVAYHLASKSEDRYTAGPESLIIIEPDWLISVTELTRVEFCPREYLVNHFSLIKPNKNLLRGNIVHQSFEQMVETPSSGEDIAEATRQAFYRQARTLALIDQSKDDTWEQVKGPYSRLKHWVSEAELTGDVSTETFVFAPGIGLKGKIDALWSVDGEPRIVGELKSGKSRGGDPKPGHRLQISAYALMLLSRMQEPPEELPRALLFYAGNRGFESSLNLIREVELNASLFQEVIAARNQLVLIDYLADGPFESEYPNKCLNCYSYSECQKLSVLLGHEDPRTPEFHGSRDQEIQFSPEEQDWFQTYTRLLSNEYREAKQAHAVLWRKKPEERVLEGTTVIIDGEPRKIEDPELTYFLPADNQSELREEDYVMVSDSAGPMEGNLAQGTVKSTGEDGIMVEFRAALEFKPVYVDKYVSESLAGRQFAGPYLWLSDDRKLDLLTGKRVPVFNDNGGQPHFPPVVDTRKLNERQQMAVKKMLVMEDYLIVHGPPGSGKTLLIQALVRELVHRNQRVLIAAGTNTAVDNALEKIGTPETEGDILRLGATGRTRPELRKFTLEELGDSDDLDERIVQHREALTERRIVAATATTWLSGDWDMDSFSKFDVAILDEAAQLSLPAALGPLRLAEKFILIGDHKQLPAVVLSEETREIRALNDNTEPRLSLSLFEQLFMFLKEQSPEGIVALDEQYRMNEKICAVPRQMWYEQDLRPATKEIAGARLALLSHIPEDHPLYAVVDPEEPVVFWHVSHTGGSSAPRTNLEEAKKVKELIAVYREHGLSFENIGVIAPFRAQVAAVRRELEQAFPEHTPKIRQAVDTVDRFQGQEKELIIVSLSTYGNFIHDLLLDQRRLNVAITRARHKLIVLGDAAVLSENPTYYSLLRHCNQIGRKKALPVENIF